MIQKLLTRDEFREGVFARDNHKCVVCGRPAQDAHHIMERRLFENGGYFLENGASLCGDCHIKAEQTVITPDEIRAKAGITQVVIPEHLYPDDTYDKWGNIVLPGDRRIRGELFWDENVQKILASADMLGKFLSYVKYPRTPHLPFSPGFSEDDRVLPNMDHFVGKRVIVTLKMDGENTTCYEKYLHARSINSGTDLTRHWMVNFHQRFNYLIPEGWRVCGENLYAKHTIKYTGLKTYFYVFSIWDDKDMCLSWDDTIFWAMMFENSMQTDGMLTGPTKLLDRSQLIMPVVPVLYDGIWDEEKIKNLYRPEIDGNQMEGFVVRTADSFHYSQFRRNVAKYVDGKFREHLNNSHGHWRHSALEKNVL